MAITNGELKRWLETLDEDATIGVDDSGLALLVAGDDDAYLEVGGMPLEGGDES